MTSREHSLSQRLLDTGDLGKTMHIGFPRFRICFAGADVDEGGGGGCDQRGDGHPQRLPQVPAPEQPAGETAVHPPAHHQVLAPCALPMLEMQSVNAGWPYASPDDKVWRCLVDLKYWTSILNS